MVTNPPAAVEAVATRIQAGQWEQGLHMEALANLAHELRSPVQAILGYLDILRDELAEAVDDRHKQMIERMNANAHDLAQTVENVMDFSVADAMAEVADEEEIRLHDLIADLAPALEAANDTKASKSGTTSKPRLPFFARGAGRSKRSCSTSRSTRSSSPIEVASRSRSAPPNRSNSARH